MNGQEPHDESSVTIERLHSLYLVSREHPTPEDQRWRLDAVMRNGLISTCGRALARALDEDSKSVWLIRRLNVDLALDLNAVNNELLARVWGQQIATDIVRTITRGADCNNVLLFADRAAYLAQFVGDLAEGRAWGKWYYTAFESLRSLPTGAAVREALIREPDQTETVLCCLERQDRLERILSVLSTGDARRVYSTCLDAHPAGAGERALIEALLSVWPTTAIHNWPKVATAHNALRLFVTLRTHSPRIATRGLQTAIDRLLSLAEILRQVANPGVLVACLATNDLRAAIELVRSSGLKDYLESLPFWTQTADGDTEWLERVVRTVSSAAEIRADASEEKAFKNRTLSTPFGGIFLLLPSLLDLDLDELTEIDIYPDPEGMTRAQALRHLLFLKCLGRTRVFDAVHDPAVYLAAGLDESPSLESLGRFTESTTTAMDQICLGRLIEGLVRQGRVDGRCLAAEVTKVGSSGREILLLRDVAGDDWVYGDFITDHDSRAAAVLKQGLDMVGETIGVPVDFVLFGPGLGQYLEVGALVGCAARFVWLEAGQVPGLAPLELDQVAEGEPPTVWISDPDALPEEVRFALARYLVRLKPAAPEFTYLTLSGLTPSIVTNNHFDLTWSLVSHAGLKAFARRLMGFEWSSVEYLYQNFMAGTSTIRIEEDRIVVQLPASPLRVVLSMAGVNGQSYNVPWLNDTQVRLSL